MKEKKSIIFVSLNMVKYPLEKNFQKKKLMKKKSIKNSSNITINSKMNSRWKYAQKKITIISEDMKFSTKSHHFIL